MPKKLSLDKNFVPCAVCEGDELFPNGIFVFNITKMLGYLDSNRRSILPSDLDISELAHHPRINESHLDSVDISIPVILAEIAPSIFNLIDGHHRVEKAKRSGLKTLKCFRLTVDQHIKFLTDERGYKSYVEYWNSKI